VLANTSAPEPVSSLITPANCAEVVAANWPRVPATFAGTTNVRLQYAPVARCLSRRIRQCANRISDIDATPPSTPAIEMYRGRPLELPPLFQTTDAGTCSPMRRSYAIIQQATTRHLRMS